MLKLIALTLILLMDDEPVFLDGVPDMPMPGHLLLAEEPVVFDSPGGLVVRALLQTRTAPQQTLNDFKGLLDAYGWACGPIVDKKSTLLHLRCEKDQQLLTVLAGPEAQKDATKLTLSIEPLEG